MAIPWQEISSIFQQVYDLSWDERGVRLEELCAGHGALKAEVESLLEAHDLAEQLTEAGQSASVGELSSETIRLAPSRRLGPYTLLDEIGRGGMSTVLLAARTDNAFDRLVAIKTLRFVGSADGYERFLAERQVHASLEHPGIARLYGGGTSEQGVPYIVMEYVDGGRPISAFCDDHELDVRQRLDLFRRVCQAVTYAHRNLVVHRDLKPNNILVTPDGDPKLLDFGISKLLSNEASDWDPTGIGVGPLTPGYASPEQILGQAITTSSDIYSLGILLFRLVTGGLPFANTLQERMAELQDDADTTLSPERVARQTLQRPADSPDAARAFLKLDRGRRLDLQAILSKALRRDPAHRYGSVEGLEDDLRRWSEGLPVQARMPTAAYRLSRWMRRNWLVASLAGTVMATLLVASIGLATQNRQVSWERDRAQAEAAKSERMLELLLGLFEGSDPARAQGAEISVQDVLADAEPRIERELSAQPQVQAALYQSLGQVFISLGNMEDAERLLNRARGLWRRVHWPDSSSVAQTLDLLAQVYIHQGQFDLALATLQQSQRLRIEEFGEGSIEEAASLSVIAYVRLLQYQTEEAELAARRALDIFGRRGDGDYAAERIEAQFNLAEALNRQGGSVRAEPILESALRDARRLLGHEHPMTLSLLGKMADLKAERPDELSLAERYAREKIEAQERLYRGKDHPELAVSLDVLAGILGRRGKLDEATGVFEDSLAMQRRLVGDASPFMAVTLGNLGWFHLFRRHDPETAEPILRQALEMAESFFPEDASLLAYPLIGIARCRSLDGEAGAGEALLRRALHIRQKAHGEGALSVSRVELYLGESLALQRRCDEAAPLIEQARDALMAARQPDDLDRLQTPWNHFVEHCQLISDTSASTTPPGGPHAR